MSKTSLTQRGPTMTLAGALAFLTALAACSGEGPVGPEDGVEITDEIRTDINTDDGNLGVILDTREIFKKGYVVATARIDFPDHPEFNATLDIDPITNLAILSIDVDSLTDEQADAFQEGVVAHVAVDDAAGGELASLDRDRLVLDDSNVPVPISTDLPYLRRPVVLEQDIPYLLQIEGRDGLVTTCGSDCVEDDVGYAIDDPDDLGPKQQFYFTAVDGEEDTYFVEHSVYTEGATWKIIEDGPRWLRFTDDPLPPRADLVLEQDEDGWVKIRLQDTGEYLVYVNNPEELLPLKMVLTENAEEADRFRIISDNIQWQMADLGTVFNQPIMPPANLDFAYKAILKNCSGATLEETIGRTEERTRTTTVGSSESLQLFSSNTESQGLRVGYQVKAKIGVDVQGIGEAGEEVTVAEDVSVTSEYTNSQTAVTENTWSESKSTSTAVSRTRTLTLPPFTAVEAYDAVKTMNDVRVPFTQMLRIKGTYRDGPTLSGAEIESQMLFNLVDGVLHAVGEDFVDLSVRGQAVIDRLFEATSNVNEIPDACN